MSRVIVIEIQRPSLRLRVGWYVQQVRLWFRSPLTPTEWYESGCPPYFGQRKFWM